METCTAQQTFTIGGAMASLSMATARSSPRTSSAVQTACSNVIWEVLLTLTPPKPQSRCLVSSFLTSIHCKITIFPIGVD